MFSDVENIENNAKLQNWSKYKELLIFDVETIKTTQNYKRDQITINLHRFDVKTIKNIEVRSQNVQNNAKLQNWSNYNELLLFDVKTIKTTQNYKRDQITINLHRFDVKTIKKHWGTVAKHSKQRKTTKLIKLQWIASICHQNNQKCWDTSQNIQNNAKLRKWSNYSALHRFDVKTIRNV